MPLSGGQVPVVLRMVVLPCKTSSNVLYIFWGFGHVVYVGKALVLANESIHTSETSRPPETSNAQVQTGRFSKFHDKESTT